MSTFDDASLVFIPSGYKTSKAYSVKPIDGTGDLTFTRSNDTATRVNSAGLIEKVRTNLFQFSEQLSNAYWGKTAAGTALAPVITENFAPAPDGSNTAERAYFNAVGTSSTDRSGLVRQLAFTTGQTYTISVYAKSATGANQILQFRLCGSQVGSEKTVTNNWQRFTETFTATTSITDDFGIQIRGNNSVNTSDLILWGFQLELSDVMTDYIPTTSAAVSVGPVANVPRLDYLGSTCPKLQLEPSRTNIQLNSEDFSQSNWSKTNSAVVTNQVASPDGYVNADKLNETAVNNIHQLESSRSVSSSTAYTMSVFAKKAERSWIRIYEDTTLNSAYFNLDSGTVGTVGGPTAVAKIENYGNGWYRCSVTYTETGTFGRYRITTAKQDNEASYLGVANNGIYVWGAQYEAGAYATSYIPTLGAAVTRGADAASKTGISSLIGQTEGTSFVEFEVTHEMTGNNPLYTLSDGTTNNNIYANLFVSGGSNRVEFFVNNGGVAQVTANVLISNGRHKLAFAYKANDFIAFIDGVQVLVDTSGTVPATSRYGLGSWVNNVLMYSDGIAQALLFKTRLSNSELAALTTL